MVWSVFFITLLQGCATQGGATTLWLEGCGFCSRSGAFLCGVCTSSMCLCGFSLCSTSSHGPKTCPVRRIENSTLSVGVFVSVSCRFPVRGPAMNWRLVRGATAPSPYDNWERLQQSLATRRTENGWTGWMFAVSTGSKTFNYTSKV